MSTSKTMRDSVKLARPAPRSVREGRVLEVDAAGLWFSLLAEPGPRRGPAVIPDHIDEPEPGAAVAVVELDTGVRLVLGAWTP